MARIQVKGKIGRIEHKQGGTGPYCMFSVAESLKPDTKGGEWRAQWFSCMAFKVTAQKLVGVEKGQPVIVEGNLELKEKDGKTYANVTAFIVELLMKKPRADHMGNNTGPEFNTEDIPF